MSATRDPDRDQPLPTPGKINVQEVLMGAVAERMRYGVRKYGRALETFNGRDPLRDAWEEAIDLAAYLTQALLERGDILPGMSVCADCGHSNTKWGVCGYRLPGDREVPMCMCVHDKPEPST